MATQKKDSGFHVKLDGIKFNDASMERIQAGIQNVLLQELAGYTPNPDGDDKPRHRFGNGVIVVPPKWWWGFIIRELRPKEITEIGGLQEEINSAGYGR